MANVCARCGATYPDDLDSWWGRAPETAGMGTQPVCIALREVKGAQPASDGSIPQAVCRGSLRWSPTTDPTPSAPSR